MKTSPDAPSTSRSRPGLASSPASRPRTDRGFTDEVEPMIHSSPPKSCRAGRNVRPTHHDPKALRGGADIPACPENVYLTHHRPRSFRGGADILVCPETAS